MKANEVILSLDFSKIYDNKQRYEIQSAYLGHECFTNTLLHVTSIALWVFQVSLKQTESGLKVVHIAIVSNETQHDRNVDFTTINKLIEMILEICSFIKTFHFQTNSCSGQYRSKYVFPSFCQYPPSIKLTWKASLYFFNQNVFS